MQPIRPDSSSNKCAKPTGSNCVIYNGKTISCIPNCNGDTVSEVLYKMGQQQCYTTSLLDWSTLDLGCCYTACPSCPKQPSDPLNVMKIVLSCICAQAQRITTLESEVASLKAGVNPGP